MRKTVSVLSICGALIAAPALAQDMGGEGRSWTTGGVAIASSSIYDGADTQLRVLPSGLLRFGRFSVGARAVAFTFWGDGQTGADLILTPRFKPYDMTDSPALAGMDRSFSIDMGLAFRTEIAPGTQLQARVVQEVTGEHDGQQVDLSVTQELSGFALPVSVYGGATWQSPELSEFLYGVRPAEALVGRPAYAPGSTFTPYVGLSLRVPINDRLSLFGSVEARFLDDAITLSPIVVEDTALSARLGVSFTF